MRDQEIQTDVPMGVAVVVMAVILSVFTLAYMTHTKGRETMSKKKQGWDHLDDEDFFKSELLILTEDGDAACFIPMEEPWLETEKVFGNLKTSAVVPVVRCGDAEPLPSEQWFMQAVTFGKRQARAYRALVQGEEGKVIVKMTRHGKPNDTNTTYEFMVLPLIDEMVAAAAEIMVKAKADAK